MKRGRGKKRGRGRGRSGKRGCGRGEAGRTASKRTITAPSVTPQRKRGRPRKNAAAVVATATTEWPIIKPAVIELVNDKAQVGVFHASPPVEKDKHDAKFVLPSPAPRPSDVKEVIMALNRLCFPTKFIEKLWLHTLQYVDAKKVPGGKRFKICVPDIFHFYSMVYYFGLVRLPSKENYWANHDLDILPAHPVCHARKMTYRKFVYLWTHFYGVDPRSVGHDDVDDPVPDMVDVTGDGPWCNGDDVDTESDDEDANAEEDVPDSMFMFDAKAKPFVDQFNESAKTMCKYPSSSLALDEMMARFKGRSADTYRMKSKPIREGYKFFAIACSQSTFVWHLLPYGRMNTKVGIIDTVKALVNSVPDKGKRMYLLAMDNYFTYDRAVDYCVDNNIKVVGTAKAKRGWPPAALTQIKELRFNFLHHLLSNSGKFRIYRWVDNGVVYMVSSCHEPTDTVMKARKRPRVTNKNKANVKTVWGPDYVRDIEIPKMVDDYNDSKTGVDGGDQLISYYAPDMRMRRTWMPQFLHSANASRANSFAHHRAYCKEHALKSRQFMVEWIRCFMLRAARYQSTYASRCQSLASAPTSAAPKSQRHRTSHLRPTLPENRLDPTLHHVPVLTSTQRACIFCRFLRAWKKLMHPDWEDDALPKIRRPRRKCLGCDVFLCKKCFDVYHTIESPDWERMIDDRSDDVESH